MKTSLARRQQAGATLIEVLVSILILMFGLLGLVGVMVQSQRAQLESFQREQALLLAQDMIQRMQANRSVATCYVQTSWLGTDSGHTTAPAATTCTVGTSDQATRFNSDLTEWIAQLQGAGEQTGGTTPVGGVPSARGCITLDTTTGIYQVSVAWQGTILASAPPASISCAKDQYNPSGDTTDTGRRAVALTALIQ